MDSGFIRLALKSSFMNRGQPWIHFCLFLFLAFMLLLLKILLSPSFYFLSLLVSAFLSVVIFWLQKVSIALFWLTSLFGYDVYPPFDSQLSLGLLFSVFFYVHSFSQPFRPSFSLIFRIRSNILRCLTGPNALERSGKTAINPSIRSLIKNFHILNGARLTLCYRAVQWGFAQNIA